MGANFQQQIGVELERDDGSTPTRCEAYQLDAPCTPTKVRGPSLCARIEERHASSRFGVNRCQASSLVPIAVTAGEAEILIVVRAATAAGPDVLDLQDLRHVLLRRPTIGAATGEGGNHALPNSLAIQLLAHEEIGGRNLRRTASAKPIALRRSAS